jgi:hypothetical protein
MSGMFVVSGSRRKVVNGKFAMSGRSEDYAGTGAFELADSCRKPFNGFATSISHAHILPRFIAFLILIFAHVRLLFRRSTRH